MKSCAQTFAPIFGLFEILERNFVKLVAPPSNNNNYLVHLKGQSMLKKGLNSIKIDPQTAAQHLFKVCHHRTNSAPASECDKIKLQTKKHTNTTFSHLQPACVVHLPKLYIVIELVEAIKKGVIHFSIQRIVLPTGCTEKFGLIDRCAVSQQ